MGSWTASATAAPPPELLDPGQPLVKGFKDQTVREIVHTSVGGGAVRLHITNAHGQHDLKVGHVTVGVPKGEAELAAAPLEATFRGARGVVIPKGGEAVTDPVPLRTAGGADLAVSIYLPEDTGPTTNHSLANQITYFSGTGDFAAQAGGQAFTDSGGNWFFLSGVDVRPDRATRAVVAFGDDLTDGFGADFNADDRWTDRLAARLRGAERPAAVLNEGVAGNRLLHDSPCFGANALARLRPDVLAQARVKAVILHEGMNDIGFGRMPDQGCFAPNRPATAAEIIGRYRQIIARLHARGVRVIGATLTPIAGSPFFSAAGEETRQKVNAWIRSGHAFDGHVDFDRAVRDPQHPQSLLEAYDWGDHLHPNAAGYQAMGDAVDLRLLG
ncbi:SGNH/GDSL hydrolase family protein [Actinomadura macrotermitis]|uniref:SGNH/GDSL hydrolase family protein n=1 Tax=Actinomadura macrotermitis TaxID=2585200 RepID=UPI0018867AF8|nr:SGNH/GDSL hydrolase family protein [Actinomadura macrotermitis]